VFAFALAFAVGGCEFAKSSTSPSAVGAVGIAPELHPAHALLRSIERVSWTRLTVAEWIDGLPVTRVLVRRRTGGHGAYYEAGHIYVHPDVLQRPTAEIAAVLAHEYRHADGYAHTCPTHRDQTLAEQGPWAVHFETLRILGLPQVADGLTPDWICEARS
jgi:hypothetical protein